MSDTFLPADPTDLVAFLASQRSFQGYNQGDISFAVGVRQPSISEWENGAKRPQLDSLMTWANALGFRFALVPFEVELPAVTS